MVENGSNRLPGDRPLGPNPGQETDTLHASVVRLYRELLFEAMPERLRADSLARRESNELQTQVNTLLEQAK